MQDEQRAQSLGAEVLVQGNFAAVGDGVGITLIASDRLAGGESRMEVLAEIPMTSEMEAVLSAPLPQRPVLEGMPKASIDAILAKTRARWLASEGSAPLYGRGALRW